MLIFVYNTYMYPNIDRALAWLQKKKKKKE